MWELKLLKHYPCAGISTFYEQFFFKNSNNIEDFAMKSIVPQYNDTVLEIEWIEGENNFMISSEIVVNMPEKQEMSISFIAREIETED